MGILAEFDAPGHGHPSGPGRSSSRALAFGQIVTIEPLDRDRYRRLVAEVIVPEDGDWW